MPAAVEHPKTAQMNFRLDPETKKRGDEALALAGYTPSEAARSLWEVAASGRYRPELIHAFLSGTIAIEYDSSVRENATSEKPFVPSEKAQARLRLLHAGRDREQDLLKELGLGDKIVARPDSSEAEPLDDNEDGYNEELAEALAEAYEEKEKNFALMTPEEVEEQLRKLGGWQRGKEVA